jgi:hypothetical protein
VLSLGDTIGLLKKGYCASMLVLNHGLELVQVINACGDEDEEQALEQPATFGAPHPAA